MERTRPLARRWEDLGDCPGDWGKKAGDTLGSTRGESETHGPWMGCSVWTDPWQRLAWKQDTGSVSILPKSRSLCDFRQVPYPLCAV